MRTLRGRGGEPVEPGAFLRQELLGLGSGVAVHGDQRLPESTDHTADGGTWTRFMSQLGRSQDTCTPVPSGSNPPLTGATRWQNAQIQSSRPRSNRVFCPTRNLPGRTENLGWIGRASHTPDQSGVCFGLRTVSSKCGPQTEREPWVRDVTSSSRCSKGSFQTRPEQTGTGSLPPPASWTCGEGPCTPLYGYLRTPGSLRDQLTGLEERWRSEPTHLRQPSTAAGCEGQRSDRWEAQGHLSPRRSDLSRPCWTFQF